MTRRRAAAWRALLARPEWRATAAVFVGALLVWAPFAISDLGHAGKSGTLDAWVVQALVADHTGLVLTWLDRAFVEVAGLVNGLVVSLVLIAVCGTLDRLGDRRRALLTLAGLVPGMLAVTSLKLVVHRPPPPMHIVSQAPQATGWPSGHAAVGVILYLGVLGLLGPRIRAPRARTFLVGMALTVVVVVGFSRVWTGLHYPSSVAGGWTLGALWLLLWSAVLSELERRGWIEAGREPAWHREGGGGVGPRPAHPAPRAADRSVRT